jgi:hypothetical protein
MDLRMILSSATNLEATISVPCEDNNAQMCVYREEWLIDFVDLLKERNRRE